MTIVRHLTRLAPLVGTLAALAALATDGYFAHGCGLKATTGNESIRMRGFPVGADWSMKF